MTPVLQINGIHAYEEGLEAYFAGKAWDELPEFRFQPREYAVERISLDMRQHDRLELSVHLDGTPVGFMVLVPDDDPHVGPCLGTQYSYVLPEHRGVGSLLYRTALKLAREGGFRVLAYTHRISETEYRIKYRRC